MFNKQSFNRGKFNRKVIVITGNRVILSGYMPLSLNKSAKANLVTALKASANITLGAAAAMNYTAAIKGEMHLALHKSAQMSRSRLVAAVSHITLKSKARINRSRIFTPEPMHISLIAKGGVIQTWRTERITLLPGLQIMPGDELVVDMDNQTVSLNGQNVMRFVDNDSVFFKFNPGTNEVTYTNTDAAGRAEIRILWHDRWL